MTKVIKKTHGEAYPVRTKEYRAWKHIKGRCHCPTDQAYKDYGARGISVCDRWIHSYESFLADIGRAPTPKHTIERKDNSKGYSPENCLWATQKEQARNRRSSSILKYNGESKTLAEWCEQLNLVYSRVQLRLTRRKWSVEKAFNEPKRVNQFK